MPVYVSTVSFKSFIVFDAERDDPMVNATLQTIQEGGGIVRDVQVATGGNFGSFVSTYLITYEAPAPIVVPVQRQVLSTWVLIALGVLIAVLLLGLFLAA